MDPYDILDKWEDHFDTPDPCALEEIMFEVKHNIVDIERFEKGIEQECKREFNEEFWGEIDFLTNGFKHMRSGDGNMSSSTNIFMAFAETPFKYANAR